MITPIKQHSVNFKGNNDTKVLPFKDFKNPREYYKEADSPVLQDTLENKPIEQTDTQQSKTALIKEKFNSAKLAFVNLAKTFNTTTGVTGGILSGVVKGALVTLGVGFIGKNVRKYRKAKGLTQAKLAEKANYSKQFISNIENNVHQTFSIGTLWRLSLILEVDMYKLCIEEKKEDEYEEMY